MATANHVLLRRITLSASASTVTFDSIPQTGYTDLKIVMSANCTGSGSSADDIRIRFNGNTSSVYSMISINGSGSGVSSGYESNQTSSWCGNVGGTGTIFNNAEIYISNYLSTTTPKSVSVDNVVEANATAAPIRVICQLWNPSPQAAINSVTLYPTTYSWSTGSSFSLYGIANVNTTPTSAPKADGGDIVRTDGTYWYHAFLSSGIFTPQVGLTADILQVAGGGGGGHNGGGGGGAGGLLVFASQPLSVQNYACTVGAGGAAGIGNGVQGYNGNPSQLGTLTASAGGGGGGAIFVYPGFAGGSGGGGASGYEGASGGTGGAASPSGQGFAGGNGQNGLGTPGTNWGGGGGGGAGGAGANGTSSVAGAGGVGFYSSLTNAIGAATGLGQLVSSNYYFAGGGAGGRGVVTAASGGSGGGGSSTTDSNSGVANTGGGGAGANNGSPGGTGGFGGSGIIIIRYPV